MFIIYFDGWVQSSQGPQRGREAPARGEMPSLLRTGSNRLVTALLLLSELKCLEPGREPDTGTEAHPHPAPQSNVGRGCCR